MKKIYVLILLVALSLASTAQNTRLSLTAKPQINWLTTNNDFVEGEGSVFGLGFGLDIDHYFADNYAFASGISLMNIGSGAGKVVYDEPIPIIADGEPQLMDSATTVNYKTAYLEIPFGLRLKTIEIGYVTYYGSVGLNTLFNIKATGSAEAKGEDLFSNAELSEEVNIFNMGYHIGGGIQYSLGGQTALIFGLQFTSYFLDLTEDIGTQNIDGQAYDRPDDKITTRNLSLRLGVLF